MFNLENSSHFGNISGVIWTYDPVNNINCNSIENNEAIVEPAMQQLSIAITALTFIKVF